MSQTAMYNESNLIIETRQISGTADLEATMVSGTAVVDATVDGKYGTGIVTFATTDAPAFVSGQMYIEGTTNYDGTHEILSVTTSGITVRTNKYVAETPVGTETIGFVIDPKCDWILYEINLHLSAAAATSENFVATLDANAGSAYDLVVFSQDVNGVSDLTSIGERYFFNGDKLRFTLPNSDGRTYSLKVVYRRIR